MTTSVTCPICGGGVFVAQGNRPTARCASCNSLERGRLAWLTLERLGYLKYGNKVLNVAPERFMLLHAVPLFGTENYFGRDFVPEQFVNYTYPVKKIDLCGDLSELNDQTFDIIMHNHVLEHIPCSVAVALQRLNNRLRPGGIHLFSIPIATGRPTDEDLNPALSKEERVRRFGQDDHMRYFGDADFPAMTNAAGMQDFVDLTTIVKPEDLTNHVIPHDALTQMTPHRVFAWRKAA